MPRLLAPGAGRSLPSERDCDPRRPAALCDSLGSTDAAGAWRENKATGGVAIDLQTNEIMLAGLAMPHSPRWHDGRMWLLNSGAGELLVVDPESGQTVVVCRMPGYLRGLCFVGTYALVGLSKIRERHIFGGLPVQSRARSCCAALRLWTSARVGKKGFRVYRRLRGAL